MSIDPIAHLTNENPLRGLSLPGLMARIEMGERGDYAWLQWLYRHVEKRNPTVRAIKKKLKGAIRSLDWKIKKRPNLTDDQDNEAEEQKKRLEDAYGRIKGLKDSIVHLALADFRGFAHCNKIYRTPGTAAALQDQAWDVTELRVVPQWHFSRRGLMTPWTYSPQAKYGIEVGTPINPRDWVVHEEDDPASEIFAKCHILSEVSDADWDGFLESYGDPAIFIILPPNVPKEKEPEYQAIAEEIASARRGSMPHGSDVKSVEPPSGHSEVFDNRLGYLQKLMVLAGTGGILSMLAEPTGIGKGASDSHDDTWLTIAAGIAADGSETLQDQFDLPELQRWYGEDVEPLVYFELERPEKFDPAIIAQDAKAFRDAGFAIDADELSEKSGYTLTPVLPPSETPAAAGIVPGAGGDKETKTSQSEAPGATPAAGSAATPPAKPLESAASPEAAGAAAATPPGFLETEPKLATNPRPSQTATAKPSIVTSSLAEAADVDAKTFAPIQPLLDALERLAKHGASPEVLADQIQSTIDALPEILGHLDPTAYADALEKALGPATVQGLRDALAARK